MKKCRSLAFLCFFGISFLMVSLPAFAAETAVYVPRSYQENVKWPLVILLHGMGATGDMQDLHLGISERVNSAGIILAVPEARPDGYQAELHAELTGLIADMKSRYSIDSAKVFIIGHSMGGYDAMSYACDNSETIAGIVVSSASGVCSDGKKPVSLLLVTGSDDVSDASVTMSLASWGGMAGCSLFQSKVTKDIDLQWDIAGGETTMTEQLKCKDNRRVISLRSQYGRHVPVFNANFSQMALAFIKNESLSNINSNEGCVAQKDDRKRFARSQLRTDGGQTILSIVEYSDANCAVPTGKVEFFGPGDQISSGGVKVAPLKFENVTITPFADQIVRDLNGEQSLDDKIFGSKLCGNTWSSGKTFSISGRGDSERKACVNSVGNISGPASLLKHLALSYLFKPALPLE